MKWNNKGNELKERAEKIVYEFRKRGSIYIFGAGMLGEELRMVLEKYNIFAGYIDNSMEKQKSGYHGARVISLEQYIYLSDAKWIVVAASEKNTTEICSQLNLSGLVKDVYVLKDFMDNIFPIISFYVYNKLFVELVQISLTERCTLRCKKCAHGCFNVSNLSSDLPLDAVKESADVFFSKIDLVKEFVLIGGEPFLYKNLKETIVYIGSKYRNKMIIFSITTNGTILPDDEIIQLCMKYDITLRVSDYSSGVPCLKENYEKLYKKVAGNKVIVWRTEGDGAWFDYGFGEIDKGDKIDVLIDNFDKCKTSCREIRGSKYYYCVMARSVAENLGIDVGKDDYLDLKEVEDKHIILEFQMGFSEKGYLDMCRYCRGSDARRHLIPAAEQK